jgi:hypothetical protein
MHEAAGGVGERVLIRFGFLDLAWKRRINCHITLGREVDKTLRQIDIARSERAADFTLRDVAIKACGERLVGDSDRIVRCRKALLRGNAAAHEKGRSNRK